MLESEKIKEIADFYEIKQPIYKNKKPVHIFTTEQDVVIQLIEPVKPEQWIPGMYYIITSLFANMKLASKEKMLEIIRKEIAKGQSTVPLESVQLNWIIGGLSRAMTHQIVRHRQMGFGQESFRITDIRNHPIRIPKVIATNINAAKLFKETARQIKETYAKLVDMDIPTEQARAIMPMGTCTYITATMNLRTFIDYINARTNEGAQDEHQLIANRMLSTFKDKMPELYDTVKSRFKV